MGNGAAADWKRIGLNGREVPVGGRTLRFWLGGAGVLALAALVCLVGLAEQPFYTKGEPREAVVVWEMAHGGGLVLPLRNGTEIPSKPPFFHWLGLIASQATGGVSELSTRLPSALLSIATVFVVYAFWLQSSFVSADTRLLDVHQNVPLLLVALGVLVCLISGQFDLSVGGMATLTCYMTVGLDFDVRPE